MLNNGRQCTYSIALIFKYKILNFVSFSTEKYADINLVYVKIQCNPTAVPCRYAGLQFSKYGYLIDFVRRITKHFPSFQADLNALEFIKVSHIPYSPMDCS